ncbi:INVOLVED IN rRNA PROCESSING 3, BPA1-Like 1 [Hibiscus trionum]|uniref:INVOLVED IN rRNA PROCESSING 3, BPA1-Like 1 n=1 Tax=Hibiscus trionum TaxID=183268 RepID=A0A9W7JGR3_HIBTR|nr:INVOLVED IN rRNA PROCESSING 3, BPA1-Like 1 [Hibiscus trionum]
MTWFTSSFLQIRSVKVSNVSMRASEQDIEEFFIFSGEIEYVEMNSDNDRSRVAYITYKDPQGAETAVLLSGAMIVDQTVTIELAPDYKLPDNAFATPATGNDSGQEEAGLKNAEDVVSTMLAKGFIIGKDALNKAKELDEKHQFTSTASAKIASLDQKTGLSEKFSAGKTVVNEKMREVDQKYQVSEKSKSALAAAEQSVSTAKSSFMKNRYALAGAAWFTAAYKRAAKAAEDVGQKTREKVLAEEQAQKPEGHAHINESSSPRAAKPETDEQPSDSSPEPGLLLLHGGK